jgi:hypothetical protein
LDAFDEEKRRVAAAFDCEFPNHTDWIKRTYGYEGENRYEIYDNVTCPHTQRWTNDAGNRRVLREHLCYFLVPMEHLAEAVGAAIPVMKAIIEILQIFADFDYRGNGLTSQALVLDGEQGSNIGLSHIWSFLSKLERLNS